MSFKKRVTKSIALALVGVTIAIPMLNTASAMENSKETYSQKIERVSKSFEDFVYLEDNQYKLDISVSELSESSKSDFYIYNDYINLLNNIIVSNNIKNVTEDGFSLQISDEMAIESAKINNIEITDEMKSLAENMTKASGRSELKMYKNGFDLWLNSFQTSLVAVGGSEALGFLVGLIPGIGASLAGTLLAAILPVISGEYCPNGIFVSYRFNQYLRVRPQ